MLSPRVFALFVICGGLAGCAGYVPKPLPQRPDLAASVNDISVAPSALHGIPGVKTHPFDAANGLDITETATLAVVNNPDLRAARARLGVGRAELFAAGLLPDPQLGFSLDHPTSSGPDLVNAMSGTISEDINGLVTRDLAEGSKAAALRKVNLEILWQEWQVAEKARQLFVRFRSESAALRLEQRNLRLARNRYDHARQALSQGNITLDRVAADLSAVTGVEGRIRTLQRRHQQTLHQLNALLGLRPDAPLHLVGWLLGGNPTRAEVHTALRQLSQRRPDLLALQAGYKSQDLAFRKAIMAQFPLLNVGLTRARDTSNVQTVGFGVTLSLPFLNDNRGNIAVAKASRAQLWHEYQARLDAASSQVQELWDAWTLFARQLKQVRVQLPALAQMTSKARSAMEQGAVEAALYVNLESSLLAKRVEAIDLRESRAEARIGLETVLGLPPSAFLGGKGGAGQ